MARLDERILRRLYLEEGHTIQQIARLLHMRKQTICNALEQWHIPRRPGRWRRSAAASTSIDGETLRRMYQDEDHTIREIARTLQVSSNIIRDSLIRWNIPRRRRGPRRDMRPLPESTQQALRALVAVRGEPGAARYLKTSPEVIHAILGTRPLPRGMQPRVDDQAVRVAYEASMPIAAIAAHWRCSTRTIWRSLQRTCVCPHT